MLYSYIYIFLYYLLSTESIKILTENKGSPLEFDFRANICGNAGGNYISIVLIISSDY